MKTLLFYCFLICLGFCSGQRRGLELYYGMILPEECGKLKIKFEPTQVESGEFAAKVKSFVRSVDIGQIPWIVNLEYNKSRNEDKDNSFVTCTGSLITEQFVVTAAHCVDLIKPIAVRLDGPNPSSLDKSDGVDQRFEIESMEVHEQWNENNLFENDIGLIKLKKKVTFNDFIQPICLPIKQYEKYDFKFQEATVAGWYYYMQGTSKPKQYSILQYLRLKVWPKQKCRLNDKKRHTENVICASAEDMTADSCIGDSGGPLYWKEEGGNTFLIGIVSYASPHCKFGGEPGTYTRVSKYVEWIVSHMILMTNSR